LLAVKKLFETKEDFLSAIIPYNVYFYDGYYRSFDCIELKAEEYDIEPYINAIQDGFLRNCVCTIWEDYEEDNGRRHHWEQTESTKSGGTPAWTLDYYDLHRETHKFRRIGC